MSIPKYLFISEVDLWGSSSGCMHLNDIYNCIRCKYEVLTLFLNTVSVHDNCRHICIDREVSNYEDQFKNNPDLNHRRPSKVYDKELHIKVFPDLPSLYKANYFRSVGQTINNKLAYNCARDILSFTSLHGVSHCLIYTESAFSYQIALWLSSLGLSVTPIVLDPINNLTHFFRYNPYMSGNLMTIFKTLARTSSSIIVASHNAASLFHGMGAEKTAVAMAIYRATDNPSAILNNYFQNEHTSRGHIRIAMTGQIYALSAVRSFLGALDIYAENANVSVDFDYYGNQFHLIGFTGRSSRLRVTNKGKVPYDQLMRLLAGYHIGYTPYPFEPQLSMTSFFSFPSKLVSYLEAGIIPIFHGPVNSSVVRLLKDYDLKKFSISSVDTVSISVELSDIFDIIFDQSKVREFRDSFCSCSELFTRQSLMNSLSSILEL